MVWHDCRHGPRRGNVGFDFDTLAKMNYAIKHARVMPVVWQKVIISTIVGRVKPGGGLLMTVVRGVRVAVDSTPTRLAQIAHSNPENNSRKCERAQRQDDE